MRTVRGIVPVEELDALLRALEESLLDAQAVELRLTVVFATYSLWRRWWRKVHPIAVV